MLNEESEANRISTVGLVARSPEGHAAKGMKIKGKEDLWIEIQTHTFRNWVNEHLRPLGLQVSDLGTDLCDGTKLVALIEALQKRTLRKHHNPTNQHQMLENVTTALEAVAEDGVKLVNIGNVDIVNGNLKLILGLIWSLIVRYQIGRSKFPPKKLMLAWLRSVLPSTNISNFTTDWNSGINLSALVDYCRPGLLPHWKNLNPSNGEANIRTAMSIAKKELGVPIVLEPEYLASPHLDELSGMTYVSYFMKENGPGYKASLNWVRNQLPERHITNFTTDWNNGELLCELVRSLGGPLPGMESFSTEPENWENNLAMGMRGGDKLGINSILVPKDMADPGVDHLGVMAYTSAFQWLPKRAPPGERISVSWEAKKEKYRKGNPIHFIIEYLEEGDIDPSEIHVEVKGPSDRVDCRLTPTSSSTRGVFSTSEIGIHEVVVKYQGEPVVGSPLKCRILPQLSSINYKNEGSSGKRGGLEPCAVGSVVEVSVNPHDATGAAKLELLEVYAVSPSGIRRDCGVSRIEDGFGATFKPDEAGEWRITVLYKNKEILNSPFPCFVYDPNGVVLDTLEGALPGLPFAFICDARGTGGLGEVEIDITHEGRSIPYTKEYIAENVTRILLPVLRGGKHRVHVYFNGSEIRSSPFSLRVGSSRSRRINENEIYGLGGGKTRSFDRDELGLLNNIKNSSFRSSFDKNEQISEESTHQNAESKYSKNNEESYKKGSISSKLEDFDMNSREFNDSVDAVHSRIKNIGKFREEEEKYNHGYQTSSIEKESAKKLESSLSSTKYLSAKSINVNNVSSSNYEFDNSTNGRRSASPFYNSDLVVEGDGLGIVPIHSQPHINIHSEYGKTRLEDVQVTVSGPTGSVPVKLISSGGKVSASWSPGEVGEHLISVKIGGKPVRGSPFSSPVFDHRAIRVNRVPKGSVGRPVEIEIDGRGAGPGHLAILVDGGRVTSQVKALGDHRFRAVFLPHDPGLHSVDMTFNGLTVPGSPWRVDVSESSSNSTNYESSSYSKMENYGNEMVGIRGDPVRHIRYGKNARFEIAAPGYSRDLIDVTVLSPTRKALSYKLLEEEDGLFVVEFTPSDVGTHLVEVVVGGRRLSVVGKVYNSSLIRVLDISPGIVGQTSQFKVDASQAGEGQLEISINDGELPNSVRVLGGGCCLVSFTPLSPKPHYVDIKFNGESIGGNGSGVVVEVGERRGVSVELGGLELVGVGKVARFSIGVDGTASAELAVSVKGPSGDLPVKVSGSVRSGFIAEFTPREVGPHGVTVHHNGIPAPGTPFVAKAYDPKRVFVSPLPRGALGRSIQFTVDASSAGEGNLEITIGAKGRNVPTQVHPQGGARFAVSFIPLEPYDHTVVVTFNKEDVPGSPFVASVSADPGQIVVSGTHLAAAPVGKSATFSLNNVHGSLDDIEVGVEGPSGVSVPASVQNSDKHKNTYTVEFVPRIPGEHRISVSLKKMPVPGSPFACKVYDLSAIKVRDTSSGVLGKPVTFLVETTGAGPGNLEVTVNGGHVPTSAQAQGSQTYAISFTPKELKPHLIELRFNSEDIPGSPFMCEIVDASKVSLSGDGLEKVPVGKRATFLIEPESALGVPIIKIHSPLKKIVHSSIQTPAENKYLVEYVPNEVGDHTVDVMMGGLPVPGSPFLVKAYDSTKVRVTDITPGLRDKPVYFSIDASQAGAGNLEIIVSVGGRNVPNYVQAEGNAKFRVNFRPHEAAPHTLSVRFNGENIPGSPFMCKVMDGSQIQVLGSALKSAPVNQPATVTIDPQGADVSNCNFTVVTPSGSHLPINVTGSLPERIQASFTPTEVGPHSISVLIDNQPLPNSPFSCNVFNVDKIQVTGLTHGRLNEPITFSVDASQAGEGTLELVVTTGKQSLRAEVSARSRGLYDVTFVPQEPLPHFVNITFNDIELRGSPFECEVEDTYAGIIGGQMDELTINEYSSNKVISHTSHTTKSTKSSPSVHFLTHGLEDLIPGMRAYFDFAPPSDQDIQIQIISPDGSTSSLEPQLLPSGFLRGEFTPDAVGGYEINLIEGGRKVEGSGMEVRVVDPMLVKIKEKNATAVLGLDYSFKLDLTRTGLNDSDPLPPDSLSVRTTSGVEEVDTKIRPLSPGIYIVTFKPLLPLTHRVWVTVQGYNVPDSPFEVGVGESGVVGKGTVVQGAGLYMARCARSAGFTILTKGSSGRDFDVVVSGGVGGSGVAVPVRCYQQRDGNLRTEFSPSFPGPHEVAVYHRSKQVAGSPYICHVYDPQKVTIGSLPTSVPLGQALTLPIDLSESGSALLESDVTGPEGLSKPLFPVFDERHGDSVIKFIPRRAGKYKIMLSYGGEPVPGCPIVVTAEEGGGAKAEGPALSHAHVGKISNFSIFGPGLPGTPTVVVEGPETEVKCEVRKVGGESGSYSCSFSPIEVGVHDVRVAWGGVPISGSPFHTRVVDTSKLRVIGGWESYTNPEDGSILPLLIGTETKIGLNLSESGPGVLEAIVSPHDSSLCRVENGPGGRAKLLFNPQRNGEWDLALNYGSFKVEGVPKRILVSGEDGVEEEKESKNGIYGSGISGARCGEEATFTVNTTRYGGGVPQASLSTSDYEIPVTFTPLSPTTFRATYLPHYPGSYTLTISLNNRPIGAFNVPISANGDASRVVCSGEGLRLGTVGKDIRSFIDTRRAGAGELTAQCTGSRKTAYCELYDHGDGTFTLNIRPQEAGKHALSIKYAGEHVPGSPFNLKVVGLPDASKVKVYGPGIEHGVLASFQSRFICDTRGAGAGQLTVRVRGPKGAFRVEMQRESQKDRTILCKFDPTEPGDYRVEVRWAGEHVPGSPFTVMIFDTQKELHHFIQGGPSPLTGGNQSEFYGSTGYSQGQMSWKGSQAQL